MTNPRLRLATPDEQLDYESGYRTFPGAIETEHGLLIIDTPYEHLSDAPDVDSYVAHVLHHMGEGQRN